ncbi:MAG: dockerin type I repeat-containing protein [Oscillospiraceae bacterium]|nr:dockerin type I repeat-containing protein [Oscillospiraceae bacterium]
MNQPVRRVISFLLSAVIVLGLFPASVRAEVVDHSQHKNGIVHVEAVAGNCTTPGNIEFWYCDYYACEKCYSDEAMTQEISPADVVITPGVHSDACVGCAYSNTEKTFDKFVPSEQSYYDAQDYANNGFFSFTSQLQGSTFLFVCEGSDGKLYAMGNETNPDGTRQAVDITDKVTADGSVTVDSNTVEFFNFKVTQYSYLFSPDNGYMTVFDGKIVVHGENMTNIDTSYELFPQSIGFEQDTSRSDYAEDKGYLYCWALNSRLILFDETGAEPVFAPALMWSEDENGDYIRDENGNVIDNRAHQIMLYQAACDHAHMEHIPERAPTCEENGNVEYWYCGNCEKNFADAEGTKTLSGTVVYALDHDWDAWKVITPATPETDGIKQRVCKNDSNHVEEETYHYTTYVAAIPATCTECGVKEHWYCEQCWTYYKDDCEGDYIYEEQLATPATGHKFDAEGVCEYCTMKRNVYTQVSTLEQFDALREDAYYLIVFKDGEKTYAACLPEENPYWVDSNYDYEYDLFVIDENENGVPDCIETVDLNENGVLDYLEDQDYDEQIGTYNDYYWVYDTLAYAKDEEIYAASNFVEVTVAEDGSITIVDERAMEFQMMVSGVWGGAPFTEEDFIYDVENYGIDLEKERIRAAWVPNYWVASGGMLGYYSEGNLITQNRRYGDQDYPGVLDNKNWKISFNEDGTACLVCSWADFDDTGALQLAKYTNEEGEADMTMVGFPDDWWDDSPIMQNRTELLPAYLYASEPDYAVPPHTCSFGEWVADETGRTHTRTCTDPECGKTETEAHAWTETETKAPTCTQEGEITYTCTVCKATRTDVTAMLEHEWSQWQDMDENNHCRECLREGCDANETEAHKWGEWLADGEENHTQTCSVCMASRSADHTWDDGVITKEPTEEEKGVKTYTCTDCKATREEEIPQLPHQHNWGNWTEQTTGGYLRECVSCGITEEMVLEEDKPVHTPGLENVANTNLSNTDIELIEAVLTDEEQSQVAQGVQVQVYLKVEDISQSAPASHVAEVEAKAGDSEVGMYLDIDLFKKVNEQESQVTETSGKVTITIQIPEELLNQDASVNRVYQIVRVHEDESGVLFTEIISGVFDPENNTFTFETDKFSTYALVYADKSRAMPGDLDGNDAVNADDVVTLLLYLTMPDLFPLADGADADFTHDGVLTTDDAVQLLLHISMPDLFPL